MSVFSQLQGISLASNEPQLAQRKAGASELGQEDFMKLLVAQMENQDPTKPMDNFQFLSQIAQFGTVDGIGSVQESLETMNTNSLQGQILQASSLLEHEVLGSGNAFLYDGNMPRGVIEAPASTQNIVVDIRNPQGLLVDSSSQGRGTFAWSAAAPQFAPS